MQKKLLSAIFLLALVFDGTSQKKPLSKDYSYNVSTPYKVIDADKKFYLSGDNKTVAVKVDKRDISIQRFDDATGNQLSVKMYEDAFPKNTVFERALFINGKVQIFFTQWDGDKKKEQLFAQEVNMDSGEFVGEPKLVLTIDGKVTGSYSGRLYDFNLTNKFPIYQSFDKKSFLVEYRRIPEKKNDKKSFDKIGLIGVDGDLKQTSKREITMPYTERRMDNLDYQLDNKGNVYILTKVYHDDSGDDKKKKSDEAANYHIELFTLALGSDKLKITKLENNGKFVNSVAMFDYPKGDVIAGGFYSNGKGKDFEDNSDGVFTFKIKSDGTISDEYSYEIPLDLINAYESAKTVRKNEKKEDKGEGAKFTDLKLRELRVSEDGGLFLGSEQYKVKSTTMTSQSGSRTYYTYYYSDILATKIDAAGKLQWMQKIPKAQVGTKGRGGMSYTYFALGGKHCFVFLDNVKNIDLPIDKTPAQHTDGQGGYLTAVKIDDATGTFTKGSILNAREVDDFKLDQMSMDRVIKTSESTFMMEAYKKSKEDIMIRVDLK